MPSPFGAQAMPLGQLFADPNFIHVPSYQRSFAWTREEAGRLLDDVCRGARCERRRARRRLLPRPDAVHRAGPADGADRGLEGGAHGPRARGGGRTAAPHHPHHPVLRAARPRRGGRRAGERAAAGGHRHPGARARLALREPEESVLSGARAPPRRDRRAAGRRAGQSLVGGARFYEVREHMRQTLAEWDVVQRRQLADFLLDKCHIVLVSATGIDRAHRMFTVLNATGRPLARNDILKASLLGGVPAAALNRATATWDAAQARLGGRFRQPVQPYPDHPPPHLGAHHLGHPGDRRGAGRRRGLRARGCWGRRRRRSTTSAMPGTRARPIPRPSPRRCGIWAGSGAATGCRRPCCAGWSAATSPAELAWFLGELDRLAYAPAHPRHGHQAARHAGSATCCRRCATATISGRRRARSG